MVIDGIDHDFGYLHMFVDGTPSLGNPIKIGDCQYVLLDKLESTFGILVPHNGQQRLLAVCPNNDCSNRKYTIPGTQTIITATNQLAAGDIIGVLGTSGRVGAHLHLNRYESLTSCTDYANCDNYMLNPLEHIEHTGVNYACRFHNHSIVQTAPENESEGFSNDHIVYPGTKSSPIMIRPQLNGGGNDNHYTAGTFNIRDVSLEIKPTSGGNYTQLKGNNYESKIVLGATDFYASAYPPYINKSSESNQGGWSKQGIYNFAYRDSGDPHRGPYTTFGGRPYDDFYFPFYHRLHKKSPLNGDALKFTDTPIDARYNDGYYRLRARVTDVRNAYIDIETDITLDNFKPYITSINVKSNGSLLVQLDRMGDESTSVNDDGNVTNQVTEYPLNNAPIGPNILSVEIRTSEPMTNLRFSYKKESQSVFSQPVNMIQDAVDKLKWRGNITTTSIQDVCFNVKFFGLDQSTNQILNIYGSSNKNNPNQSVKIPTRKGSGAQDWNNLPTNSGSDQIDFCVKACSMRLLSDHSGNRNFSLDCEVLTDIGAIITYNSCNDAEITLSGPNFDPSNIVF